MDSLVYYYQHLPYFLDPTAFSVGFLRIEWYSLAYVAAFLTVYFLLRYRIKKEELPANLKGLDKEKLFDFLIIIFVGLLIGARLGYVFFYNFSYYFENPVAIISPFDMQTGKFTGLYGMSYHGGLLGAVLAAWIFAKKNKLYPVEYVAKRQPPRAVFHRVNFWRLVNFTIPAIPAGYFFGRIGNFLNGELFGRQTDRAWGMFFPTDSFGLLRHPSQLYEALGEGIILFIILWTLRNKQKFQGKLLGIYLLGYAIFRIAIEFFRAPDEQIGYIFNFLTLGQILSLSMLIVGVYLVFHKQKSVV